MVAELTGVDADMAAIEREIDALEQEAVVETARAARVLMGELLAKTPVWSGRTVRNYAIGVNGPAGGGEQEPIGGPGYVPGAGWAQQRLVDPGPTNSMALGEEPRRAANESAAREEMEGVIDGVTQLSSFDVTNFSRIWDLVDSGSAPMPGKSRAPGGVSMLAEQAAKAQLGENWE